MSKDRNVHSRFQAEPEKDEAQQHKRELVGDKWSEAGASVGLQLQDTSHRQRKQHSHRFNM